MSLFDTVDDIFNQAEGGFQTGANTFNYAANKFVGYKNRIKEDVRAVGSQIQGRQYASTVDPASIYAPPQTTLIPSSDNSQRWLLYGAIAILILVILKD